MPNHSPETLSGLGLPHLQIKLFGQLEIWYAGTAIRPHAPRMALPLLAKLLLNRTRALGREELAHEFWPDEDTESSRANLRRNLHILSKALPPAGKRTPWIMISTEQLQWNPDASLSLDVAEFARLRSRRETRESAVALYRGDLLESYSFSWVLAERERLKELCIEDLLSLLDHHRHRRDLSAAIASAKRILELDPWRESALRQLMAIRHEAGDGASALAEYEHFAQKLRAELKATPMADTRALRDAIAADGLPGPSIGTRRNDARPRPAESLPFVGRRQHLDELLSRWNALNSDPAGAVVLSGAAGIGKTRLCNEFAALVRARGGRVLTGAASHPEVVPYQCVTSALNGTGSLIKHLGIPEELLKPLLPLIPDLAAERTSSHRKTAHHIAVRGELFEATAYAIKKLASSRSTVAIIEDVHWAGRASLDLLQYLVRAGRDARVMYVITCREEEAAENDALRSTLRALRRERLLTHVALEPLTEDDVAELAHLALGNTRSEIAPAETLYLRSQGNALFLHEIILAVREGKVLEAGGVADAIRERTAGLTTQASKLASIASVLGTAFDIDDVKELSGWTLSSVITALDELTDRDVVRETPNSYESTHEFSHHLLQVDAYESATESVRVLRHRRAAKVISKRLRDGRRDVSLELARHYDISGDRLLAARHYRGAAEHAISLAADDDALLSLARSLELADGLQECIEALLLRERIFARRGARDQQQLDLDRLEDLGRRAPDSDRAVLFEALARRCEMLRAVGDTDAEERCLRELDSLSEFGDRNYRRARTLRLKAARELAFGHHDSSVALAEEALRIHEDRGDPAEAGIVLALLTQAAAEKGDRDSIEARLQAFSRWSDGERSSDLLTTVFALGHAAFMRQDFRLYRDLMLQGVDLSRKAKDRISESRMLNALGIALTRLDEFDEAEATLMMAHDIAARTCTMFTTAASLVNLGLLRWRVGDFPKAESNMRDALGILPGLSHAVGEAICRMNISGIIRNLDRCHEAVALAEEAVQTFRETGQPTFESSALMHLGIAQRQIGAHEAAVANLERALSMVGRLERRADRFEIAAELALSLLYEGNAPRARDMIAQVLSEEQSDVLEAAWWPQKYYWIASRIFEACGDSESAFEFACRSRGLAAIMASKLTRDEGRSCFLNIPLNLEIRAAVDERRWPNLPSRERVRFN